MNKQYPLIPIEDGYIMVYPEAPCPKDSWAIFPNTVNGKIKDYKGCKPIQCEYDYAANGVHNLLIIGHTGIPSLKESGLPLIELPYQPMLLARESAAMNNYDPEDDTYKHGFVNGYKAAGGYTEEDVRKAIKLAREQFCDMYDEPYKGTFVHDDDFIIDYVTKKTKKKPVAAVLEMNTGTGVIPKAEKYWTPKIVNGYIQIKEVIYDNH